MRTLITKMRPTLLCLVISSLFFWSTIFNQRAAAASLILPENYADFTIMQETVVDIDGDGAPEKIINISDILINHSFGRSKTLLLRTDGIIAAISAEWSDLRQLKVGDFNNNGKTEVATLYGYTGSAGFGTFYLHEYNPKEKRFQLLITRNDVENNVNIIDTNNDGFMEVIYDYHIYKWGVQQHQIYKWNKNLSKYILE